MPHGTQETIKSGAGKIKGDNSSDWTLKTKELETRPTRAIADDVEVRWPAETMWHAGTVTSWDDKVGGEESLGELPLYEVRRRTR